ncbi:hypothetical protein ACFLTU_00905 [Bacteroidota bacterium]
METLNPTWNELFEEKLNEKDMLCIRGGDDPSNGDPEGPIIK